MVKYSYFSDMYIQGEPNKNQNHSLMGRPFVGHVLASNASCPSAFCQPVLLSEIMEHIVTYVFVSFLCLFVIFVFTEQSVSQVGTTNGCEILFFVRENGRGNSCNV